MSKLLPCPWCKATPSIFDHGIVGVKDEWSVYCKGEMCAVAPSTTGEFKQHAVSQWNNQTIARTRTPSDAAVRAAADEIYELSTVGGTLTAHEIADAITKHLPARTGENETKERIDSH